MKIKINYTHGDKFHPDTGQKSMEDVAVPLSKLRYDLEYADKGELWFSNEQDSIGYQAAQARIKNFKNGKQSRRSNIQKFDPQTGEQVSDLTRGGVPYSKLTFSSNEAANGKLVFLAPGTSGAIVHKSAMKALRKFKKIHGDQHQQHDPEEDLQEGPKPGSTYEVIEGKIIYNNTGLRIHYNPKTGEEMLKDNEKKSRRKNKDTSCTFSELTFSRKGAEEGKWIFCPPDDDDAIAYTTTFRIVNKKEYDPPQKKYVNKITGAAAEKGGKDAVVKYNYDDQHTFVDSRSGKACKEGARFAITKQQFDNKKNYHKHIVKRQAAQHKKRDPFTRRTEKYGRKYSFVASMPSSDDDIHVDTIYFKIENDKLLYKVMNSFNAIENGSIPIEYLKVIREKFNINNDENDIVDSKLDQEAILYFTSLNSHTRSNVSSKSQCHRMKVAINAAIKSGIIKESDANEINKQGKSLSDDDMTDEDTELNEDRAEENMDNMSSEEEQPLKKKQGKEVEEPEENSDKETSSDDEETIDPTKTERSSLRRLSLVNEFNPQKSKPSKRRRKSNNSEDESSPDEGEEYHKRPKRSKRWS